MKKLLLPFFALLLFAACNKQEAPEPQGIDYNNLEGQDYIDNYTTPDIFFSTATKNLESGAISGWYLDIEGKIFTFDYEDSRFPVDGEFFGKNRFRYLTESAVFSGKAIDLVEVVDYYKQTRIAAQGTYETSENDLQNQTIKYYNAYDLLMTIGCETCPVSAVSEDDIRQVNLKMEGGQNGLIDNSVAKSITNWMDTISEQL